jgi:hypothetical protein
MMVLHGDLGNPCTLWTAAHSVFERGQGIVMSTQTIGGGPGAAEFRQ